VANVLVTGADRGIGAALVRLYRSRGDRAIAACLKEGRDLAEEGIDVVPRVDVTDAGAVARLGESLAGVRIDVLISNAGVGLADRRDGRFDFDVLRWHYEVNALGPLRVVEALSGSLGEGSKVGIITSRMGSIGDNASGGLYGYRMSKAAANQLGVNLYHELRPRGIRVVLLHPGTVATEMTKGARDRSGFLTPEQAAAGLAKQLDRLGPDTPPEFRHSDGTLLPW
jgi:NAD(P)-dependent dehydrogenase (short-subunit alcohol dehydrogenase family)